MDRGNVVLTVAYLANEFPSAVEPYVSDEILELRRRGVRIIAGSVRGAKAMGGAHARCSPEIILQPVGMGLLLRAGWLFLTRGRRILPFLRRVIFRGDENPMQRMKALAHTGLGACYAAALYGRGVRHIHVHHGYFGSWIGMVAAKLLGVSFSVTIHGSDLLLHARYLDIKIGACAFCLTVSEYNRRYLLERYPAIESDKVEVARLGVEVNQKLRFPSSAHRISKSLQLLAVGRLHAVKNHAFLVRACAALNMRRVEFRCLIAGDGPERRTIEGLIRELGLEEKVRLLGHIPRERMNSLYDQADAVTLTSRSEGVPLVLMEAMARGRVVVAPNITGIPELVIDGKTGFLYEPGSQDSFLQQLLSVHSLMTGSSALQLDWVRHAARAHVGHNYNRSKNLELFGDMFLERIAPQTESIPREDFVLQQI
jgi:colanic acid/amylovoran biosynthesis glycosyltransferase